MVNSDGLETSIILLRSLNVKNIRSLTRMKDIIMETEIHVRERNISLGEETSCGIMNLFVGMTQEILISYGKPARVMK